MRLFLPAVPHTVTHRRFSHCAFTMKVLNACKMWTAQGLHVIHLGVEGSDVAATEHVELLSTAEHLHLLDLPSYDVEPQKLIGDYARSHSPVYRQFNYNLREQLKERLDVGDVLCLPFGHAHDAAYDELPIIASGDVALIETGIGYPSPFTLARVYDSEAWRHWCLGSEMREGVSWQSKRLEWVAPNYYDVADWPTHDDASTIERSNRVVFLGRLENVKGLEIVPQLARACRHLDFVLCGQGDATPYLGEPNVFYHEPIHGAARAQFLGNALCGLYPSRFVEPFCGAAVETMLCGTPIVTSDFGAFTETNISGVTGFRCRSIDSFIDALHMVHRLDRNLVRLNALVRYSLEVVGKKYETIFGELRQTLPQSVST